MSINSIIKENKGFTLVELLLVIVLMGAIAAISINSFNSYSNYQKFSESVSNFVNVLNTAKSKASSQVKPTTGACAAGTLQGYRVILQGGSNKFTLNARCSGADLEIEEFDMDSNVHFRNPLSINNITFNVYTGAVTNYGNVVIRGWGNTYTATVTISPIGVINVVK